MRKSRWFSCSKLIYWYFRLASPGGSFLYVYRWTSGTLVAIVHSRQCTHLRRLHAAVVLCLCVSLVRMWRARMYDTHARRRSLDDTFSETSAASIEPASNSQESIVQFLISKSFALMHVKFSAGPTMWNLVFVTLLLLLLLLSLLSVVVCPWPRGISRILQAMSNSLPGSSPHFQWIDLRTSKGSKTDVLGCSRMF